jgi:hypothetical protein
MTDRVRQVKLCDHLAYSVLILLHNKFSESMCNASIVQ